MTKKKKTKCPRLAGTDIALAVLAALGGSILFMTIVAVAGSIMFPDSGKRVTADQPTAASQVVWGTLPSKAPAPSPAPAPTKPPVEPSNEPTPEQVVEPTQQVATPAATPAASRAPTATPTPTRAPAPSRTPDAQNPAPAISIAPTAPPVRQTQALAQTGNQGLGGNADNFYAHDNPDQQQTTARYVLNTSTMKFHYPTCNDVARIAHQNYAESNQSRSDIMSNGYSPCGHCNP